MPIEPGSQLLHYRLIEQIGEGGMGVVYLARQETPIRRPVAIKVIKLGMDTREVLARFEAEKQAMALMSHPSIAQVYDAGTTEDGRPYFAMEYVDGQPMTTYCDAEGLDIDARLRLFISMPTLPTLQGHGLPRTVPQGAVALLLLEEEVALRVEEFLAEVPSVVAGEDPDHLRDVGEHLRPIVAHEEVVALEVVDEVVAWSIRLGVPLL